MPDEMPDQRQPALPIIEASEALYARARRRIPGATQTLAKGPTQYVRGVAPKYLQRGRGSHVHDVDGNEYVDFNMAIGPVVARATPTPRWTRPSAPSSTTASPSA